MRVHLPRWGDLRAPWSMQRWFLWKVHNTFPHVIWPQGVGGYDIYSRICMHMVCMHVLYKFYENSENCIQKRCAQTRHCRFPSIFCGFRWFYVILFEFLFIFGRLRDSQDVLGVLEGPRRDLGVLRSSPGRFWDLLGRPGRVPGRRPIITFRRQIRYKCLGFGAWAIFSDV